MIRLQIDLERPGAADGLYTVQADGALTATLGWADSAGPLPDWTAFAALPIDPSGRGAFRFAGGRAVPREATHVFVRALSPGKREEEALFPLPDRRPAPPVEGVRLGLLTDLHLSGKPWRVGRALAMAGTGSAVLCAGDMVNDGTPEQFALLRQLIADRLSPATPMLAVAGNHDLPVQPGADAGEGYHALQDFLLDRAERLGLSVERDEGGGWTARLGNIDIVGLNAAVPGRKLAFQRQGQLPWLDRHLTDTAAAWHIVLCHAPLLAHNPQRRRPNDMPYFSRDGQLQKILEGHRDILFLSGHTHISMNSPAGCVEADRERSILYVSGGSVRTTTMKPAEALQPREWTDGNMLWLDLAPGRAEITAVSLASGKRIARGYYRFGAEEDRSREEI